MALKQENASTKSSFNIKADHPHPIRRPRGQKYTAPLATDKDKTDEDKGREKFVPNHSE